MKCETIMKRNFSKITENSKPKLQPKLEKVVKHNKNLTKNNTVNQ